MTVGQSSSEGHREQLADLGTHLPASVDLTVVPGMSSLLIHTILAEVGPNLSRLRGLRSRPGPELCPHNEERRKGAVGRHSKSQITVPRRVFCGKLTVAGTADARRLPVRNSRLVGLRSAPIRWTRSNMRSLLANSPLYRSRDLHEFSREVLR
jgi:hypothetical protein